jgi:hypothetical protein
VDQWTPEARDMLGTAVYRAASQDVQKHIIGEVPAYMNNPYVNVVLQYLSFPIVASNKQLSRNAQFADMEALTGVMLNLAVTGTVQYAMSASGIKGIDDFEENTYKYYSSIGILPEVSQFGTDVMNGENPIANRLPILSVLGNYAGAAGDIGEYALGGKESPVGNDAISLLYMNNHATLTGMVNLYQNGIAERVTNSDLATMIAESKQTR